MFCGAMNERRKADMTAAEFRSLFRSVCNWGKWDGSSERGALNYLTADEIVAAARLVKGGKTISLSWPLATQARLDVPEPADHHMTMMPNVDIGTDSQEHFVKDYIGLDYHNDGHSHIDAFCHVVLDERLYGGKSSGAVTSRGSEVGAIDLLSDGLVGRGVFLDVPRLRRIRWVEPGEHIFPEDLEEAEQDQGVTVGPGDILLVRTGHARRLSELAPWDTRKAKSGLHPTTARFLSERRVAALGSDGNNDTAPSTTEGIGFPIHVLALNSMGLHLLDYLQLEDLALQCEQEQRWDFLFVASPLRIQNGTGSPVNPVAVF
jgi:kynurenine formamidase